MEATWAAAGPHSPYVEINGEKFIRRDTCAVLRTLVLKGDMNTRKLFLSNCALNPADVGAVSRQDAQNWFGDSKSDHLDVPVYTLEEEGAIGLPDGSPLSSPEHSGPSRPELTEVETPVKANPPVETGLSLTSRPEVHAPAAPEAFVQKRRNTVELARTQLEEIMSDPEVELAVKAMMTEAQGLIPGDRGRAVKRLGSAYARMATSGPKSQLAIKAWVLGARAHGVLTNIGALIYGDATVRTFAALDLSQTVNGFLAHKLARYAKTKALAETLELLADNPLMNLAGKAGNVFFFAQNVRNVAEGHHSPADYYWLTRSSMQMLSLVSVDILVSFTQPSIKMDLVVDRDANHCDLSLYRSGATTTYCCTGSDCFPAGLQDVSRCELLMPVVSPQTTTSNYTTTRVTVTAKGFGIAALKDRESGRHETPEDWIFIPGWTMSIPFEWC
ncbi:hypothetical protein Q5P01_000162 [Channa striata]|uniref:Uncharacterized protein n=1 Tax=Channa striata TaxID=64152 RepID=A0AA88ICE5_CHASR|nr:hypothetical protein Q5P01_000162 [Channa striata]